MPDPVIPAPQVTPKAPETPAPVVVPAPEVKLPETPAPSVHDAAIAAVEAWQTNPTPELKAAAQEAIKQAKEFKPEPAKADIPEKYELKLPDGAKLDAKHPEAIAAFAKANGLSQKAAQALLERDANYSKAQVEKIDADYKTFMADLAKQAKADPEIGGANFDANVNKSARVIARFDTNGQVQKVLDESGYGSHPEIIRFFTKVFAAMKEDDLVIPSAQPGPKKSMEEKFYPNMTQK